MSVIPIRAAGGRGDRRGFKFNLLSPLLRDMMRMWGEVDDVGNRNNNNGRFIKPMPVPSCGESSSIHNPSIHPAANIFGNCILSKSEDQTDKTDRR